MRVLASLAVFTMLCGCSVLDQIQLNGPERLDPNKAYLGRTNHVVGISARDTVRYACVGAPMMCTQRGVGFDCRCL